MRVVVVVMLLGAGLGVVPLGSVGADAQGVAVVSVGAGSAAEGEPISFTVSLSEPAVDDVVVEWVTEDDTATGAVRAAAGVDYRAVGTAQRLVIYAGSSGGVIKVATNEDGVYEGDETFRVQIVRLAQGIAHLGDAVRAVGTIVEDDGLPSAGLHQSAGGDNDAELTLEGGSSSEPAEMVFRVYLSGLSGVPVTVPYTLEGTATAGTDYTDPAVKQVVIPAGELSGEIAIETLSDSVAEGHETVIVKLGQPTNAVLDTGAMSAKGKIFDDDRATHVVLSLSPASVPEFVGMEMTYELTASLGGGAVATSNLLVGIKAGGFVIVGGGHTASVGEDIDLRDAPEGELGVDITIPAGQNSGSNTFKATVTNDSLDEFDEAVAFGHPTQLVSNTGELHGPHNGYTYFYPRLLIEDDDGLKAATVSVGDATAVAEGDDTSATVDMVFPVALSAASGKDITVWYSLGGTAVAGVDYNTPALFLEIPAGATSGRIVVPVRGDTVDEGSGETVVVTLLEAVNAPLSAAQGAVVGTGTITDDDAVPTLSVGDAAADEGAAVVFAVSLSQASGQDVSFKWRTADDRTGTHPATAGGDYAAVAGRTVVIPAGQAGAQVSVLTVDDEIDEHAETFKVELFDPSNASLSANSSAVGTVNADAADPAPSVTISDAADVAEGDDPAVTADMRFPVRLSSASGKNVSVAFAVTSDTATAGDDYAEPTPARLTIPAGQTQGAITVGVKGDTVDEFHDILTVTLSDPVNAVLGDPAAASGKIRDDEGADRPWVRLAVKERSVVEGESVTVELRASSMAKEDIDVNFYVGYERVLGGRGHPETGAWFADTRGVGLQIATIPAGQRGVDFEIATRADAADFDGNIWAAMLTPGLIKTKGIRNIGNPDGSLEPYQPDWDSFKYFTGTPDFGSVEILDGPDAVSPQFNVVKLGDPAVYAGEPATFLLRADAGADADITVSYEVVAAGGVVASADQGAQQTTVPAGAKVHWITVPTQAAGTGADHTLTVRLARGEYTRRYYVGRHLEPAATTGTHIATAPVRDRTPAARPEVQIAAAGDVTEGAAAAFTITADSALASRVLVWVYVRAIGDYGTNLAKPSGTVLPVRIPAGQTEAQLLVATTDDNVDEPDGSVTVQIISQRSRGYKRGANTQATAKIKDNDAPGATPQLAIAAGPAIAEGGHARFTITATPAPSVPFDAQIAITAAGDFGAQTGTRTLTIPISGTAALTVSTTDDAVDEPHGTITAAIQARSGYTVSTTAASATATVNDDDTGPQVSITSKSDIQEGQTAEFAVTADPPSATALTVTIDITATGQYGVQTGTRTLTIPANTATAALTVSTTDDSAYETDGTITAAIQKTGHYTPSLTRNTATATVTSDDPAPTPQLAIEPKFYIRPTSSYAWFAITANPAPVAPLKVKLHITTSGDYGMNTGPLTTTITGEDSHFTIRLNDAFHNDKGSVTAQLKPANNYTISTTAHTATTTRPSKSVLSVTPVWTKITEGGKANFKFTMTPPLAERQSISATVTRKGVRTIWSGTKFSLNVLEENIMQLTTKDDLLDNPDGSLTVTLEEPSADAPYTLSTTQNAATVVVADDDDPPPDTPVLSIAAGSGITEGQAAVFTITASPAPVPGSPITVNVGTSQSGDFGASGPATVTVSSTSPSASYSVTTVDDSVDEANGSVTATVKSGDGYAVSSTAASATVTVADDDPEITLSAGANPIIEGGSMTVTLRVDPAPAATRQFHLDYRTSGDFEFRSVRNPILSGKRRTGHLSKTLGVGSSGEASYTYWTSDDDVHEPDGYFTVNVRGHKGGDILASVTITVKDNDPALPRPEGACNGLPTVSIDNPTAKRTDNTVDFTISLDCKPDKPVTVYVVELLNGQILPGTTVVQLTSQKQSQTHTVNTRPTGQHSLAIVYARGTANRYAQGNITYD